MNKYRISLKNTRHWYFTKADKFTLSGGTAYFYEYEGGYSVLCAQWYNVEAVYKEFDIKECRC